MCFYIVAIFCLVTIFYMVYVALLKSFFSDVSLDLRSAYATIAMIHFFKMTTRFFYKQHRDEIGKKSSKS